MNKSQFFILMHHMSIVAGIYIYGFSWTMAFLSFLFGMFWAWVVGHNIIHYYFSHGKYEDNLKSYFYTFLSLTSGLGSPISFSASHRQHHKFVDTEKDPHSPAHIGWKRVYFLNWAPQNINPRLISDFARSKFQKWVHKRWYWLHIAIVIILLLIDPRIVFFALSPGVLYSFHSASLTNTLSHIGGTHRNAPELKILGWWGWKHADHHNYK
jgi:stearoyl-CoA desaturase (delta-9 desaturase)